MHDSVLLNAEGCSEGRQWYLCLRIDSGAGCGTSKWEIDCCHGSYIRFRDCVYIHPPPQKKIEHKNAKMIKEGSFGPGHELELTVIQ